MPRRNNRKVYTTGKTAAYFSDCDNAEYKPECIGCAFTGYGGVCTTSDGTCLKATPKQKGLDNNATSKR